MDRRGSTWTVVLAVVALASACPGCGTDDDFVGADCAPNCQARTVSQGLGPRKLAIDEQNVYWIDGFNNNDQTLRRAPRAGGDSTTLTQGVHLADLVIDSVNVYFSDESMVKKVPKAGGAVEIMTGRESGLVGLALADGQLFWTSTQGLRAMPLTGGAPQTLSKGTYAGSNTFYRVIVDAKYVYWPDNGNIFRAPRSGGDPIKLRSGPGTVYDLALSGGTLFFAMGGLASDKGVYGVSIDGGTPRLAGTADGTVEGIAIEGGALYYSDTEGGSVVGPHGVITRSTRPGRLVVLGASIFWVDDREANIKAIGP